LLSFFFFPFLGGEHLPLSLDSAGSEHPTNHLGTKKLSWTVGDLDARMTRWAKIVGKNSLQCLWAGTHTTFEFDADHQSRAAMGMETEPKITRKK